MAIDASLVVQVNSVGIKESTDLLKGFTAAAATAESATASLATATSDSAKSNNESSSAADKLLAKFRQQVDLLGANVSETNAYVATTKKATEGQVLQAQMLGAQVDAYKRLGNAQREASAEVSKMLKEDKALEVEMGRVQQAAMKMNAEWEKGKSLNLAGQRAEQIAAMKATEDATVVAGKAAAKGGHDMEGFSFATASAKREVLVLFHELATGNFIRFGQSLIVLGERTNALGAIINYLKTPMGIVAVVALALAAGLAAIVYHSENVEKTLLSVSNALAGTGRASALTKGAIKDLAHELSMLPNITKDDANGMITDFARIREIGTGMYKELAMRAADLAAVTGKDLPSAAKQLAEAMKDPSKGLRTLQDQLGTVSTATLALVDDMMAHNNIAGAQKLIMQELAKIVGGLGTKQTELQKANKEVADAFERITSSTGPASSGLNIIYKVTTKVISGFAWLIDHAAELKGAFAPIIGISNAIVGLTTSSMLGKPGVREVTGKMPGSPSAVTSKQLDEDSDVRIWKSTDGLKSRAKVIEENTTKITALQEAIKKHSKVTEADNAWVKEAKDRVVALQEANEKKEKKGGSAEASDIYGAKLKALENEVDRAKRQLASTKELDNMLFKTGQIGRFEQIERDSNGAVAAYKREAEALKAMLAVPANKNNRTKQEELTKRLNGVNELGAAAEVTATREAAIELSRLDKENTEHHIKELEYRGKFDEAAALKNTQIFGHQMKSEQAELSSLEDKLKTPEKFDILGMLAVLTRIDAVKERLRGLNAQVADNLSKGAFDTAKANFDRVYQGLQDRIAALKQGSAAGTNGLSGTSLIGAISDELTKAKPLLQSVTDKLNDVAKAEGNVGANSKIAAKATNDVAKEMELLAANDPYFGLEKAVRDYGDQAAQSGAQIQSVMGKAFKGAEDALTTFIRTGKLSFKSLVDTMLTEMARIQAQKLIAGLTGGNSGGGLFSTLFSAASTLFGAPDLTLSAGQGITGGDSGITSLVEAGVGAGRAYGGYSGPNMVGEVNEKGPEMLTTGGRDYLLTGSKGGTITPNDKLGGGINITSAPTINIDARSDQAQVRQLVQQAVQQGNAKLVDTLNRQRKI